MINRVYKSFGLLLVVGLTGCFLPEEPIQPYDRGDAQLAEVTMSSDYRYQAFFDLGTNSVVGTNLKTGWDLGFESSVDGYHVIVNFAKNMRVASTGSTDFASVGDTVGTKMQWDDPTGDLTKTAIGEWGDFSGTPTYTNEVFIIDRGTNWQLQHEGFRKIQLLALENDNYTLRFADLNGSNEQTVQVAKDYSRNFTYFSFGTNTTVQIEPPKEDWDLLFTQHVEIFEVSGDTLPYLVVGVLTNWSDVVVAEDSITPFANIAADDIPNYEFSEAINTIGYDWKYFDFNSGTFLVLPEKNYIVLDPKGFTYKLHFTDFYNNSGDKGHPEFEFQLL